MERRLTEESITLTILEWLQSNKWKIICFDFPQSGTGMPLHPNEDLRESKNRKTVIPDIIAIKNGKAVFFENKNRFVLSDITKLEEIKNTGNYSQSLGKILQNNSCEHIFYGIGIQSLAKNEVNILSYFSRIDFVVFCNEDRSIVVKFDPNSLFI